MRPLSALVRLGHRHPSMPQRGGASVRGEAPDLTHARELVVELVPDGVEVRPLDVELLCEPVREPGLRLVDLVVGRHDQEAAAEQLLALLHRRDRLELAGDEVVLGGPELARLGARQHHDQVRGLRVELADLDHERLHLGQLGLADREVGVGGPPEQVGERREVPRPRRWHRGKLFGDELDALGVGGRGLGDGLVRVDGHVRRRGSIEAKDAREEAHRDSG